MGRASPHGVEAHEWWPRYGTGEQDVAWATGGCHHAAFQGAFDLPLESLVPSFQPNAAGLIPPYRCYCHVGASKGAVAATIQRLKPSGEPACADAGGMRKPWLRARRLHALVQVSRYRGRAASGVASSPPFGPTGTAGPSLPAASRRRSHRSVAWALRPCSARHGRSGGAEPAPAFPGIVARPPQLQAPPGVIDVAAPSPEAALSGRPPHLCRLTCRIALPPRVRSPVPWSHTAFFGRLNPPRAAYPLRYWKHYP
jgi:hypothetical protein